MSYARRGPDSDVYVFSGDGGRTIDCCHCSLGPDFSGPPGELLKHLGAHLMAGDKVPAYVFNRIERAKCTAPSGIEERPITWIVARWLAKEPPTADEFGAVLDAAVKWEAHGDKMLALLQRAVVAIEPELRGRGVWGEIEALLRQIDDGLAVER